MVAGLVEEGQGVGALVVEHPVMVILAISTVYLVVVDPARGKQTAGSPALVLQLVEHCIFQLCQVGVALQQAERLEGLAAVGEDERDIFGSSYFPAGT